MNNAFRKVRDGEKLRIPATAYNAMIDAAQDYIRRKTDSNLHASGDNTLDANMVYVKNTTGSDVERYSVLAIAGNELSSQTDRDVVCFTGVAPTGSNASGGRFVITADPIADGKIGRAWVSGCVPVQLSVSNEAHVHADIIENDCTKLQTSDSGPAVILWKESGTGIKSCFVRLGGEPAPCFEIRRAKLTQDAPHATTITANLYDAAGIEQTEGPEADITVYCLFAHPTGALSEAIPRLHEGQDIFVIKLPYNEDGYVQMRWYCLTIFQRIDPVLTVQDGGLTTMLYLCS